MLQLLGTIILRHADLFRRIRPALQQVRGMSNHQAHRAHQGTHFHELVLDALKGGDWLAKLMPCLGKFYRSICRSSCKTNIGCRDDETLQGAKNAQSRPGTIHSF